MCERDHFLSWSSCLVWILKLKLKVDVPENSPVIFGTEMKTICIHLIMNNNSNKQTEISCLLPRQHPQDVKVRQSCDGEMSLTCKCNNPGGCWRFYFCVLCVSSLFWELSTNDANATSSGAICGEQASKINAIPNKRRHVSSTYHTPG